MKQVDLHRHLDGSLRLATLRAMAAELGVSVPDNLLFTDGMTLTAALSKFAVTLSVLQTPSAVRRIADEMCLDAIDEGLDVLEIRFAPQLHHGGSLEEIVDAALEGAAGRAGIILCGLYGEPPAVLDRLVDIAIARDGVVGIDLAGGPAPAHDFTMKDYGPAFARARDNGIGRTVHAGEGRPPAEIAEAIEVLHAQRIGHGTTLLDDAEVVDLVLARGVTIEACPTSNVHTGVISQVADHPIRRWLELGIDVCVCADNTLLSATTAVQEIERLGLDAEAVRRVSVAGHAAAFSDRNLG